MIQNLLAVGAVLIQENIELLGTGIGIGTVKNGEFGMISASTKSCIESI